ncbi:MAG: hypothetical protein LUQ49_03320, partial [Methanomicrobiales archaeon]|nr:hypothetical protein [Methanomicrobiales archaeon]
MENSKGVSPRENQQGKTLMEIPFRSFIQSLGEYINTGIHPAILHVVTLLIPMNIYVIGDRLGAGVQWPLVRYQETYLGRNVISIFTDGGYILHGNFTGRTALSTSIWILGAILLFLALGIALWQGVGSSRRNRGYLLISGTFSFLISSIIQYGLYFHGPAGIFIPVGMPVLLILGGLLLRKEAEELPEVKGVPPPSRPRLQILILFLLCFLIYNTISSIRMSGDTTPAQMIPLSILGSGTISLDQFHASFLNPDNLYAFVQVQGHYYSYFPIVTPVLLTPLYVPPYLLISVLHIPLTPAIVAPLARYASAVVAASGVVLIYLTTRALFSKIAAILTTITYAFGTTTWAI